MKQLISQFGLVDKRSAGLYTWQEGIELAVLGNYDGTLFEGGDKLSMGIMGSNKLALESLKDKTVIAEGDRFTNSTFIAAFNPYIIRIKNNGAEGRKLRGSEQTERHIKSIQTRVNNISFDKMVEDSSEAFIFIKDLIENKSIPERKKDIQPNVSSIFNIQ